MAVSKTVRRAIGIVASILVITYFSVSYAGGEPRLIVVGDSLSTTLESWPSQLRRIAPRWNIQVMAQNGRTIRDFSLPRDLWTAGDRNETVVYFLGGNDILQRYDVGHATWRLRTHINFLLDRNFNVLLICPPSFGLNPDLYDKTTALHREMIDSYRGTHPNLVVYDIDNVWDPEQTSDGVHPEPGLSFEIALVINMVLAMNFY